MFPTRGAPRRHGGRVPYAQNRMSSRIASDELAFLQPILQRESLFIGVNRWLPSQSLGTNAGRRDSAAALIRRPTVRRSRLLCSASRVLLRPHEATPSPPHPSEWEHLENR